MTAYTLIVTEKPSVSQSIASVLGAAQKRNGYIEGSGYLVSWCAGHLLELAAPDAYGEQYAKWRYADLPIIPAEWKHIASKDKAAQLKILKDLMNRADVDCIVNACDAGREGELIFRLVYEHSKCKKPLKRLWISSMEDAAIREGFAKLKSGAAYDNLYAAASCRERADWLVGINITRLFSTLYGQTLSVGRVQTPTLAMLTERASAIAAFRKEPFYTPEIQSKDFTAAGEKLKNRQDAESICTACAGQTAIVKTVERREKSTAPPKLYDLTALQRDANRKHGYSAMETLTHLQSLYEKKLATYPRTDSQYITGDMAGSTEALVEALAPSAPCQVNQIVNDAKVSDHHAILPTIHAAGYDLSQLHAGEQQVLRMVIERLLCAVGEKHLYAETEVTLVCAGHEFHVKGKTVIHAGWKTYVEYTALPVLTEGETLPVTAAVKEGFTVPPKPFTEDTLLAAMENAGAEDMPEDAERKGLGTPATRAAIIEKLLSGKDPLAVRSGKSLVPTEKAAVLISILPERVKSPKLTAEWEHTLGQVERGELGETAFMEGIRQMVRELVRSHSAPDPEKFALLPKLPDTRAKGKTIGVCPRCGKAVIESAKAFGCENRDCTFALWKENRFFASKKIPLTADIAAALLTSGRVALKGLYSERTGNTYDAAVVLSDTGGKFVGFRLEFGK